jgi:hypothetical protein
VRLPFRGPIQKTSGRRSYQANSLKPKKHNAEHDNRRALVHLGNQAPRRKACTTQTTRRSHTQMTHFSTNTSGQRYPRSLTTQNATVVLNTWVPSILRNIPSNFSGYVHLLQTYWPKW